MALMFQRIARNFARNGYFPTDEASLERVLQALSPASAGRMRVLDPCAGRALPSLSLPTTWGANAFRPAPWSITPSGPPRCMAWWIEAYRAT